MATTTRESGAGPDGHDRSTAESLASQLGLNRLGEQLQGLASAMADRGVSVVTDRLDGLTNKMSGSAGETVKNMAKGDSAPKAALKAGVGSVKDKVGEAVGGDNGGDKGKDKMKFINIVEESLTSRFHALWRTRRGRSSRNSPVS
jgi:hypothetical protein